MEEQGIIIIDSMKILLVQSSKVENGEVNKNNNITLSHKFTPQCFCSPIPINEEIISLFFVLYEQLFQSYGEQYWGERLLCYGVTTNTFFLSYGEQCKSLSTDYDIDGINAYPYQKLRSATMISSQPASTSTSTISTYEEDSVTDHTFPINK